MQIDSAQLLVLWILPQIVPVLLIAETSCSVCNIARQKRLMSGMPCSAKGPMSLLGGGCFNDCLRFMVQGEGNVQSLLTVQPRSGMATMLRNPASSERSPVQLVQPAAGADSSKGHGAVPFATGAWLQPTKLAQAAGMTVS